MTVVDEPIEFEITPEDAAKAIRRDANRCLVARALRRVFPGKRIAVTGNRVVVDGYSWYATAALRRAIHAYDDDGTVLIGKYLLTERYLST